MSTIGLTLAIANAVMAPINLWLYATGRGFVGNLVAAVVSASVAVLLVVSQT